MTASALEFTSYSGWIASIELTIEIIGPEELKTEKLNQDNSSRIQLFSHNMRAWC